VLWLRNNLAELMVHSIYSIREWWLRIGRRKLAVGERGESPANAIVAFTGQVLTAVTGKPSRLVTTW
jgi:hypothetical protein